MNKESNPSVLLNAFHIDKHILLITEWKCIVVKTDLEEKYELNYKDFKTQDHENANIERAFCCNSSIDFNTSKELLIGFEIQNNVPHLKFRNKFQ